MTSSIEARAFVEKFISDLKAAQGGADRDAVVAGALATTYSAKLALGREVLIELSASQQEAYVAAHSVHYTRRVVAMVSQCGDLAVSGVVQRSDTEFAVAATAEDKGSGHCEVSFRVRTKDGAYWIIDLTVNDLSMLTTEREAISSCFKSRDRDVDRLIAWLKESAAVQAVR
ncbi:ABC transporter substrate-binding protein [Streptomyces sp. NPDC048445]|uniref:ABC transporter substrate-binding protein n=1 Tax=Streptomyces sp. NPDC048445 TaxID=3365553 RepID=UPI003720E087